jgi:uncharacterized protein
LKALALVSVGVYRCYVSPHKGFSCAWRVHRRGSSCSAFAERAIRRCGVPRGMALLQRRLRRCGNVHRQHHALLRQAERGSCDAPCDIPCDGSELKHCDATPCDCADCGRRHDDKKRRGPPQGPQGPQGRQAL